MQSVGDQLYQSLTKAGIEVLYDDRTVSAGVMFSDADLFGIPIRVIVSPRNLDRNIIEIMARDKKWSEKAPLQDALQHIIRYVAGESLHQ